MVTLGVIGFGYWGPNLIRNFSNLPNVTVSWICDLDTKLLGVAKRLYPNTKTTRDYHTILADDACEAVVVATPISTHFTLTDQALGANKHVLVEKPLTVTSEQAKRLVRLARKKKRILMVDHTYVYTPAVGAMKALIKKGDLGKLIAIDSVRTNLGLIQKDVNVIYDLAVHDFSIIDFLLQTTPSTVSATGTNHPVVGQETSVYVAARYPTGVFAHVHVSWLTPVKIRRMMLIGTKKMLLYDDNESSEKVKIYDRGISVRPDTTDTYQQRIGYRTGAVVVPYIPLQEGLKDMTKSFVRAIETGIHPPTDDQSGLRVVRILESATQSLRKGALIRL